VAAVIVVDASVLIAFLEPSDAAHHEAVALMLSTVGQQRIIHALTLAEVLVGAPTSAAASAVWDTIVHHMRFTVSDAPDAGLIATIRRTTRLKMPDAVVLATAVAENARVASFDNRLLAAADASAVPHL
jgi:predicted nucleic acid-binding protein